MASLGGNEFRYQFAPAGFDLLRYQEIDIRFDPSVFGSLANGVAGPDFTVTLLQPNNPVGAFGDYSILSRVDHASLLGPFSVDVTVLSGRQPSSSLSYNIHQFDSAGLRITATIGSGFVDVAATDAPEPGGYVFLLLGLASMGALRSVKLRR